MLTSRVWTELARTTDLGKMKLGWTIGGVIENAFAPNQSVKVDGLYVDLGRLSAGLNSVDSTTLKMILSSGDL